MKPRFLNAIVFALCLIAPWSLLWLDASLIFPYETGKAWFFRLIVELAFVLFLAQSLFQTATTSSSAHRLMSGLLVLYLVWSGLTLITGIDPYRSFWSNYERMAGVLSMVHWAMYFICLRSVLSAARVRIFVANLLLIMAIIFSLSGLDDEKRAISTLGNPIYLGNLAVFGLFLSAFSLSGLSLKLKNRTFIWGGLALLVLFLALMALLNAASRGPFMALAAGLLGMMLLGWLNLLQSKKVLAWVTLLVGVMLLGVLLSQKSVIQKTFKESEHYALQRLGDFSLTNQTVADRLENWRIAGDAARAHPILGWGQGNYMIAFTEYYRAGVMDEAKIWFDRAHNAYLDVLVASGFLGLVIYILVLALPLWLVSRHLTWSSWQKAFVSGLLVAYMAKNLVGFDTFSSTLLWLSVLAVIMAPSTDLPARQNEVLLRSQTGMLFALLMLFATSAYWLNIKPYHDNQYLASWIKKRHLGNELRPKLLEQRIDSIGNFALNSKLSVYHHLLMRMGMAQPSLSNASRHMAISRQVMSNVISRELKRQPRNYRIRYNAGLLLADLGHYSLAIKLLEGLTTAAPNRTVFWYHLAKVYTVAGEAEKASQAKEKINQLNPNWKP